MKTVVVPEQKITLFEYSELSDEAKEKVKEMIADEPGRVDNLSEYFNETLICMFPESSLKADFCLAYCQGDGVNIYGKLSGKDAAALFRDEGFKAERKSLFTPADVEAAETYLSWCESINLPRNPRYGYCMAGSAGIAEQVYDAVSTGEEDRNAVFGFFVKMERFIVSCIEAICGRFETEGYKFLYDPDEDEISEKAALYGWMFYENGVLYDKNKITVSLGRK